MMELEDSRQQLRFISEDLQAIRSVALMADENRDWDTEGDIVRLIALAVLLHQRVIVLCFRTLFTPNFHNTCEYTAPSSFGEYPKTQHSRIYPSP